MQIIMNDKLKVVEIWLCSDEVLDKDIVQKYSKNKYSSENKYPLVIFRSGNGDFFDNTVGLLKNNLHLRISQQ